MNADILRRVIELPYDDPRRKALLEILHNEFATNLLTGLPVQGVLFKPAKWKEQVSVYMGLPPPETRKSVNQHIIIKGVIRGKVDLHANNLLNSHYATGGGTSLNHNTILGNVEVGLHDAGVPFKSTGSTNGQGTKNTFRRQLPENPSGSSLEKTNKIIPDLVIRASHLSGSNGVDCDLDGANHIVDFKTLQGLSHYDNTSTIPGATLEKRQKAVNKEYHDRTRKLDSELHGSQQDQRGPIESELNEYGHRGRVLAPVIGRYGGASSDLSLILDLVAREMARKHTAFYNIGFSEAKALFRQKLARKWGHAIARGWATLLLDRLRDFVVVPSSAGGNSSFELHSQSMEERATLDRYHHFHGHSGMCA
jgi:hypothetical protein